MSALVVGFVAASGEDMAAGAFFIGIEGAGLAGAAPHDHKHIHPLPTGGASDLGKAGVCFPSWHPASSMGKTSFFTLFYHA